MLELAEGDGTPDKLEPVGAQESRVLPDGLVDSGGRRLLVGGAPYEGNITEVGPAGVVADKLLPPLAEGTPGVSVAGNDGVRVKPLEDAPEGELVPGSEVLLGSGRDTSAELLEASPADVKELEAGGNVALLCGSVLTELGTSERLSAGEDEVSTAELGGAVPEESALVLVVWALSQSWTRNYWFSVRSLTDTEVNPG